jgi:hypothetical protein
MLHKKYKREFVTENVQFDIISGNLDSLNAKFKNMQNKEIFSVGPEQSPL